MHKILVTGDRNWQDYTTIAAAFVEVLVEWDTSTYDILLIHGAAKGADSLAGMIGQLWGMQVDSNPAHWRHTDECPPDCQEMVGKPAGVIRNQKMLDKHPDIRLALVFHSDLSKSKGTKDMVRRLEKHNIPYRHFK